LELNHVNGGCVITGLRGFVGSEYARRLVTNVVRQPSAQPQAAMPCAPFVAPRPPIAIKSAAMHWDLVRTVMAPVHQKMKRASSMPVDVAA
jgi:hypothetical protein